MSPLDRLLIGCMLLAGLLVGGVLQIRHYGAEWYAAGYSAAVAAGQVQHDLDAAAARKTESDCVRSCTPGTPTPMQRNRNMQQTSKLLSAACALALTVCAAPQPAQYQPAPRPAIEPLPPELSLTPADRSLYRKLLQIFSASPETLQDSCADTSASSSVSKPAAP